MRISFAWILAAMWMSFAVAANTTVLKADEVEATYATEESDRTYPILETAYTWLGGGIQSGKGKGDCDCPREFVPTMLGDGGLVTPSLQIFTNGIYAWQNHAYKVGENNSVLPQDRVGFNFNHLNDVPNGAPTGDAIYGDDMFEYRFFAEKTLWNDNVSIDFMVPFYHSSEANPSYNDITANGADTATSFGDIAFGMKALLRESDRGAVSVGLRVEAPTNDDFGLRDDPTLGTIVVDDELWHFSPYVGGLWTPRENLFVQSFLAYRMATGSLRITNGVVRGSLLKEQDLLTADVAVGYWLLRDPCRRGLTGLAPMIELHYTGALDDTNEGFNDAFYAANDVLNMTLGVNALFNERISAGMGLALPLRETRAQNTFQFQTDRRYDWAFIANVNVLWR